MELEVIEAAHEDTPNSKLLDSNVFAMSNTTIDESIQF